MINILNRELALGVSKEVETAFVDEKESTHGRRA
ncbi:hypothetical protein C8K36_108242 [Rhodococcus sp. OK519]|nr:hypothetical protein C8K36_108242 [Rhodococcus sp. OK519]